MSELKMFELKRLLDTWYLHGPGSDHASVRKLKRAMEEAVQKRDAKFFRRFAVAIEQKRSESPYDSKRDGSTPVEKLRLNYLKFYSSDPKKRFTWDDVKEATGLKFSDRGWRDLRNRVGLKPSDFAPGRPPGRPKNRGSKTRKRVP